MPLVEAIANHVYYHSEKRIDREELMAEGSLAMVRAAHRFKSNRNVKFGAYVRQRIQGSMHDLYRHKRIHECEQLPDHYRLYCPRPTIHATLETQELELKLLKAVFQLPRSQRLYILLHYYEGLKHSDIAVVLKVGLPMTYWLKGQAIAELRHQLRRRNK